MISPLDMRRARIWILGHGTAQKSTESRTYVFYSAAIRVIPWLCFPSDQRISGSGHMLVG